MKRYRRGVHRLPLWTWAWQRPRRCMHPGPTPMRWGAPCCSTQGPSPTCPLGGLSSLRVSRGAGSHQGPHIARLRPRVRWRSSHRMGGCPPYVHRIQGGSSPMYPCTYWSFIGDSLWWWNVARRIENEARQCNISGSPAAQEDRVGSPITAVDHKRRSGIRGR